MLGTKIPFRFNIFRIYNEEKLFLQKQDRFRDMFKYFIIILHFLIIYPRCFIMFKNIIILF